MLFMKLNSHKNFQIYSKCFTVSYDFLTLDHVHLSPFPLDGLLGDGVLVVEHGHQDTLVVVGHLGD